MLVYVSAWHVSAWQSLVQTREAGAARERAALVAQLHVEKSVQQGCRPQRDTDTELAPSAGTTRSAQTPKGLPTLQKGAMHTADMACADLEQSSLLMLAPSHVAMEERQHTDRKLCAHKDASTDAWNHTEVEDSLLEEIDRLMKERDVLLGIYRVPYSLQSSHSLSIRPPPLSHPRYHSFSQQ